MSFGGKEIVHHRRQLVPDQRRRLGRAADEREDRRAKLGLTPLARIVGIGVGGVKPQVMGLGPIVSTKKALRHAGIERRPDRPRRVQRGLRRAGDPVAAGARHPARSKVNVNGGSIAIGHPLGATGARLVTTVAKELRRSGRRYGLATQCIGAGMGISTILERIE